MEITNRVFSHETPLLTKPILRLPWTTWRTMNAMFREIILDQYDVVLNNHNFPHSQTSLERFI